MTDAHSPGRGRDLWIAATVLVLATAAMAIDHLVGTGDDADDGGLADPGAFLLSMALTLALAGYLFGRVVPRAAAAGSERAAKVGLVLGLVALVLGVGFIWLGFPFVLAGAAIALGLTGRTESGKRRATLAFALGVFVAAVGAALYAYAALV